ncbi:ribosomal protein S8 [Powellomyces hirtus]|nr:ribosomal protein S8 [Powellomyces hirtus]
MAPVHNLCSMIQNSFRWQLRSIAVPVSTTNKEICRILYEEGFISSLAQGNETGPYPPTPQPQSSPQPSASSPLHSASAPTSTPLPLPPRPNPARQKLWLTLKYRDGQPVLRSMSAVSKPSRRVFASLAELQAVAAARRAGTLLKGQQVGQVTILNTPYGIIELKEALQKEVGGEVLCIAA